MKDTAEEEQEKPKITPANEKIIGVILKGLRAGAAAKDAHKFMLKHLAIFLQNRDKTIREAGQEDLAEFIEYVETRNGRRVKESTSKRYKAIIKTDYRVLHGLKKGEYPGNVRWINIGPIRGRSLSPKDFLTVAEIEAIVKHTTKKRDACLFTLLGETGMRIGEALALKIKDIKFETVAGLETVVISIPDVPGKTKTGARTIRAVSSCFALRNWINEHPDRFDNESQLFPIIQDTASYGLHKAAKAAGIKKKVFLHLFRHSSMFRKKLDRNWTDSQIKVYHGLAEDSTMLATYGKLSSESTDSAVFGTHGIDTNGTNETQGESPIETGIKCEHCGRINPTSLVFCSRCNKKLVVDKSQVLLTRFEKVLPVWEKILNHPKFIEIVEDLGK